MLRHTALFLHRDGTTPEQQLAMLKGLAYMRYECRGVRALDYGVDLHGGSARRRELKPWLRTPIWRAQSEGPASHYDMALHLDFDGEEGFENYNRDSVHGEVGAYNAAVNQGEFTARVNYWYDGPPSNRTGHIRHCALFLWSPQAGEAAKQAALEALGRLAEAPGVERLTIGHNVPLLQTDYDWIVELHVADQERAGSLLEGDAYREAMDTVKAATQFEWTARISHRMHGL